MGVIAMTTAKAASISFTIYSSSFSCDFPVKIEGMLVFGPKRTGEYPVLTRQGKDIENEGVS